MHLMSHSGTERTGSSCWSEPKGAALIKEPEFPSLLWGLKMALGSRSAPSIQRVRDHFKEETINFIKKTKSHGRGDFNCSKKKNCRCVFF